MPQSDAPILVADDEELLRTLTRRILEREGFAVECAADSTALQIALATDPLPRALILDFTLPPEGGIALLKEIEARAPGMAIVVISGDALPSEAKGQLSSRVSFLAKPYPPAALLEALRRVLEASPG